LLCSNKTVKHVWKCKRETEKNCDCYSKHRKFTFSLGFFPVL